MAACSDVVVGRSSKMAVVAEVSEIRITTAVGMAVMMTATMMITLGKTMMAMTATMVASLGVES